MTNPHPFVSCGDDSREKKGSKALKASQSVEAAINKIFSDATQETRSDRESVGRRRRSGEVSPIPEKSLLWQPHDFRLYIDFDREGFKPKKPSDRGLRKIKTSVARFNPAYTFSSKNHGKEFLYKDFMGCTLEIKKHQVAVHNRSHAKQWRLIKRGSIDEIKARITEVMKRLEEEAVQALQVFIRIHGGKSSYRILYKRCEHGIHGDSYLDRIPPELVINDTVFKKVYQHKVEFKDEVAMKTYIANRSIEEIAPDIARSIDNLAQRIKVAHKKLDFIDHLFNNNLCDWWNDLSPEAQENYIKRYLELGGW